MRKTKIVATVGPACKTESQLKALVGAGVDIFRINTSHTSPEELRNWMLAVRKACRSAGKDCAILVDLQGPRIRTGKLKGHKPVKLVAGDEVSIAAGAGEGTGKVLVTPCRQFPSMLKRGDRVLLDNGLMELKVEKIQGKTVRCRIVAGGMLGENKGINLPSAPVTLPTLGDKDHASLRVAAQLGADYLALSFVRSPKDVLTVRQWQKKHGVSIPIVAKIEKPAAVDAIDGILEVADAIMVARGDLGIEMGVEKIPRIQKTLIEKANAKQIPVITATQMLESMMTQIYPTRAEASDIANAVLDGTDAVMLSGETASGQYPLPAVKMMAKIIVESESGEIPKNPEPDHEAMRGEDLLLHAVTDAARDAANDLEAKGIVVFTGSGKTAVFVSKLRPSSPVYALSYDPRTVRRLRLLRGVNPVRMPRVKNTDQMIKSGARVLISGGYVKGRGCFVVVSGKSDFSGAHYMVKIYQV
jgi:pyruvate kinase